MSSNRLQTWAGRVPGVVLALAIGVAATLLGGFAPIIGGPVIAIVLGVAIRQAVLARRPEALSRLRPGIGFASKQVLQAAVVTLGLALSISQVLGVGKVGIPVMVVTLAIGLVGMVLLGKLLRIAGATRTLVGVGTTICGASAIATVSGVIAASEVAVAVAMTTIFAYNIAGVVLFPLLGHLVGLDQAAFGLWAGTAVNDTSSVVAAATIYGPVATENAVVVKLTRTLALIPIAIGLSVLAARRERAALLAGGSPDGGASAGTLRNGGASADAVHDTDPSADAVRDGGADSRPGRAQSRRLPWNRFVPPFILLFLVAVVVRSVGIVPADWAPGIHTLASFLTTTAMAAIGLSVPLAAIRESGWRPMALGGLLWVLIAATSLAMILTTVSV